MRWNKKPSIKSDKTETIRTPKRGVVGYSRKSALLEEAITQMNAGKYGRSSAALKELLALDPVNMEARRLFATLHLRLGSLIPAREAFDALLAEAFQRQDYWLAESLLREYLAAGPRCVPYLEKLGTIYQEKGNVLEAVEEYGKAVDILIEDPDPERPDHAGQLYSRIRELAPASPVAFRLASYFDAETGQLVPRQPS
ncbi:MAG: tetratricopeptide repeat protein, partial [Nitrospira sp.]|nr:tetratricopeptide repeat protein [Nitrospira sp.]